MKILFFSFVMVIIDIPNARKKERDMKLLQIAVLLSCTLALAACGGGGGVAVTPEQKIAKVYVSEMENMASAIEAVHDEASAKKAASAIRAASVKFEAMAEKYDGKLGGVAASAALSGHQSELMAVQSRIAMGMSKLAMSDPALLKIVSEEMNNMPK